MAQLESARRSAFLMLAIARLTERHACGLAAPVMSGDTGEAGMSDAERLVSFGCAIHNRVLSAHAAGFGTCLTSGQALASPSLVITLASDWLAARLAIQHCNGLAGMG